MMGSRLGSEPVSPNLDEVARRTFHAICKIIADGVPEPTDLLSDDWSNPRIGRDLSNEEAKAAARIAMWVEEAAKGIVNELLAETHQNYYPLVQKWLQQKGDLTKYKRFLENHDGRQKGAASTKKKAETHADKIRNATYDCFKAPEFSGKSDGDVAEFLITRGFHKHPSGEYTKKTMTSRVKKLRDEFIRGATG